MTSDTIQQTTAYTLNDLQLILYINKYDLGAVVRKENNILDTLPETLPAKLIQLAITMWSVGNSMFRLLTNPNITKDQMSGICIAAINSGKWKLCKQHLENIDPIADPAKIEILKQILTDINH